MGESKLKIYIKIIINFLFAIGIALLLLLLLPRVLSFFAPFVIGWIVSMIANPLVRFLEKKVRIVRKHGSAIIIILVIAAILGVSYLLISILVKEVIGLTNDLPAIVEGIGLQLNKLRMNISKFSGTLPDSIQKMIDNIAVEVTEYVNNFIENIEPISMTSAGAFAKNIAEGFLQVIITILSAYFFTASRDELINGLKKRLPETVTSYWHLIYSNFMKAVGGYFKAQFKIMLVLTGIMFLGFELLQVPYSFLLALGIAFLDLLPVFGTGAILWPWALVDVITGDYMEAVALMIIYLICQVVKQILQPKMVGDSIGLHPLATLIFMYIGYKFYGVLGMIIGIPIGMVLMNMYRIGLFDRVIRGFKIIAHDINEFRKF